MDVKRKEFIAQLTERMLVYSADVIHVIDTFPRDLSGQIIAKQLLRCATSVGANFVEAQAAPSKKDFSNFISISLKSANETKYWLKLLIKTKKENIEVLQRLFQETEELSNILGAIVRTIRKNN